ncbi:MAG: ferritin family protein [Fibrobacterales bacterium]
MSYSITEVLEFALAIEETGYDFYVAQAERTTNPEVKSLFERLARDEAQHKKGFKKILNEVAGRISDEGQFGEEYFQYIKMLVKDMGFKHDKFNRDVKTSDNILDVVLYAMNREKDTVQYYTELKTLVSEQDQVTVDRLIEEEKEHFATLFKVYESLEAKNA